MASTPSIWISIFILFVMTSMSGVRGRAVDVLGFGGDAERASEAALRTGLLQETHQERCAELGATWLENAQQAPGNDAFTFLLRARPFSPGGSQGTVFPGKSLFNFVRRVYQCCQEGLICRSVKGIQGRSRGDRDVEFLLTKEILSLRVTRAELHLQISNPQHLDIHPVLPSMAKRNLPTRYNLRSRGNRVELRVDLMLLFQSLQEAAGAAGGGPSLVTMRRLALSSGGEAPGESPASRAPQDAEGHAWGDGAANELPALDLGLVLGCSHAGVAVSCEGGGIHLSHTPFMALYYR